MPRGMDERFDDPSEETDTGTGTDEAPQAENEAQVETTDSASHDTQPNQQEKTESQETQESDDPLNIRQDWDSSTIYIEPDQSEDIEVTFTRLKKQLKREGYILEKNKHFYRAIFEIAFDEYREETKEKIRELVKEDAESQSQ